MKAPYPDSYSDQNPDLKPRLPLPLAFYDQQMTESYRNRNASQKTVAALA
jgi:hypothetical protein